MTGSLRLARDFASVVLAARDGEKLAVLADEIQAIGAEPLVLQLDLMTPAATETIVKATSIGIFDARSAGSLSSPLHCK